MSVLSPPVLEIEFCQLYEHGRGLSFSDFLPIFEIEYGVFL